ncbi:autophagy-related protein 2 homolog B isoform X2 [Scaptodrosophila lebanonensis]|uniref:Autophagy-related protein 2 n=1 Tax=Drosophila lebanonensis TaxID=7225 RepID=A0A6J2UHV9_DROLE|nr:autophagy-related protein 2 homolog B isoform X2 [Scaptodrosophila lebanonensis]
MSWFNLWDGLKTKTCRYLLQRYLGQFFENNLNLEQLKVDLYNGKAVVENVSLKLNAFNDLCEEQGWAFEVVSGHIGCLTAIVPWNALMTNDSSLEIFNLTITLRPFIRKQNGTTMLESMWSSVSSSMQMAEECMNQVDDDVPFLIHNNAIIGLEKFAETIDNVLNRIHANLKDTTVNIEYILPNSGRKLLISFQANHVEYKNMTGNEKTPPTINEKSESNSDDRENNCNISPLPTITKHNLILRGLTILTSETFLVENNEDRKECNHKTKSITKLSKIVELKGYQNIQINIKQDENIIGPKVNLEVILDEIVVMLTPRQIHLLIEIINGFNNEYPTENIVIKDRESDTAQEYSESTKMSGVITPSKEWGKDKTISGIRSFPIADNIKALSSNKRRLTDSIISSESAHSTTTSFANANQEKNNLEKSGEILKFKMQIACVMGIILHKDILFSNCQNEYGYQLINVESYQNLSRIENNFFMFVNKDNPVQELELPEGNSSYLFFKVSPILLNGNQQRQYHELSSIISVSATMVDVSEILDNNADSLILFSRTKNCVDGYHKHPEVMVTFSSLFSGEQNCNRNYSKVECILDDCLVDLDISIYDRLSAHFAPSPFLKEYNSKYLKLDNSKSTIEVYIQSPFLKLHLRFPMVDGRLPEDPNKIAWWKKNIRRDYLVFNFQNIAITWKSHLRIVADEIQIFYAHGNLGNDVTHIINCVSYNVEGCATNQKNEKGICIDVEQAKQISHSLPDDVNDKNHSPFSSKCTYGFTSPVEGLQYETGQNSFLPGETEELDDFCHKTMTRSDLQISVFVPLVKVVLESKQLYEIMYNRINGDLFMWEPRSPLFKTHEVRSHTEYNSSDDYSNKSLMEKLVKKSKNNCALKLVIDEMKLIMCTQVRDIETHVHPSQSGKFQFELKELQLFIVMGFNGDKNLNYICIQLNEMNILHCGLVPTSSSTAWSDEVDENIYQIIHNIPKLHQISNKRKETIAVAAEIKKYPKQNLKRMKVSFGINGVILRHTATLPGHSWLTQLIDFLDIADFPIDAYQPFALVTEIQVHLWNSAIDYRPKHFMYRAVIDIGSGNLSSNIVSSISGCTLGLIAEDCVLKIGPYEHRTNKSNFHISTGSLIPVLDIGLFNISLRLNEQKTLTRPRIDIRCSIHEVHLRTCFDSASALAQLISYVANESDLSPMDETAHDCKNNKNDSSSFLLSQVNKNEDQSQEHVNKLIKEALKDADHVPLTAQISNDIAKKATVEVFFFPDEPDEKIVKSQKAFGSDCNISDACNILNFESNVMLQSYYNNKTHQKSLPFIQADLGSITLGDQILPEEKEFCIINEDGMDQFGIKQINVSEDPLRIVENHFCLPHEKVDLLRAPVNFPDAEYSYTLCEMTITWHLFGGKDFPDKPESQENSRPSAVMSETYKYGVSQGHEGSAKNYEPNISHGFESFGRNTKVLVEIQLTKIRFSHEIYPQTSIYSSRQVLLVSDIEIRDRLQSSDINKLLYRGNNKNITGKNEDSMVIIKALHVRPDPQISRIEECSLRVSITPIKLNIDQDTLLFIEEFFAALLEISAVNSCPNDSKLQSNILGHDTPVMSVNQVSETTDEMEIKNMEEKLETLLNDTMSARAETDGNTNKLPIYFREVIFSPAVPICLDYHGRRIELSRGPITGLLMGLAQLQGSGICLREIINRRGLLGWDRLLTFLCKEWLKDIKRNQLPTILSGIGPTNAVLQLFHGLYDLFWLPIEQYNKDGRIIRGFQLGAQSFGARTAIAALEITSRIINILQFTAETTFDILSAGPSVRNKRQMKQGKKRRNRPKDIREGVANAYTLVKEGINDSANTLIEAAITEHDQNGYTGAVGAIVRQIPQLVVCPAVLATQATTNILGGAKSSLVPDANVEAREKWKHENK